MRQALIYTSETTAGIPKEKCAHRMYIYCMRSRLRSQVKNCANSFDSVSYHSGNVVMCIFDIIIVFFYLIIQSVFTFWTFFGTCTALLNVLECVLY